jgi:arginyl-tRNA synthetase
MRLLETVRSQFFISLQKIAGPDSASLLERISPTRDTQFGDYQANLALAMTLAKQLSKDSVEVAQSIADQINADGWFESAEVAGKGFVNLKLKDSFVAESVVEANQSDRLAVSQALQPKTYIVDYSSPNVAKPMHVGHIRSTVIGDSIVKILRYLGHTVISDNHLGDWGTQFGMVIYGYKNFANQSAFDTEPVAELSRLYRLIQQIIAYQAALESLPKLQEQLVVLTNGLEMARKAMEKTPADKKLAKNLKSAEKALRDCEESIQEAAAKVAAVEADQVVLAAAQKHPGLATKVLQETVKLHEGDAENLELWEVFLPHCKAEIHQVYKRLGIEFDYELGESYYHEMLQPTVDSLVERGMAKESQGAICVFLDGFDAPMIIQKQDGAFLYSTTDLATVEYRMKHFKPDAMLYVVDHRQGDHFKKLFACLKQTGLANVELRHVSFGTVLGKDGRPFKTRSGTVVGLESLLDEAVERALQVVCNPDRLQKASLDLSESEQQRTASIIGLGAIKYADLSHHRETDYEFDLDKMVQLEGNTSAYIQYSFARTQSILRKLDDQELQRVNAVEQGQSQSKQTDAQKEMSLGRIQWAHPMERTLAIQLLRFEDFLHQSMEDYLPSVITDYLYELARMFASFFDQCPVLRAENATQRATRRLLVECTGKTLQRGLLLLGIDTVERM